ncbi:MAG: hypothetical protein M3323_10020 [Actinomycetota bacterium]|nr:hypothetical protein [Actinomycetota bacterium]
MGTRYRTMVRILEDMHPGWDLDIQPPPQGPRSGAARQVGGPGLVRYAFLGNGSRPCLEFYSFHRVWGDSHARIYESGEVEHLAVLESTMTVTGDPSKDGQQRERQNERNRRLIEELEAAGLLSGGPVPNAFVMNAAIVTGVVDLRPE